MKILNWLFRKYLRKYLSKRVVKLSNAKFISDIEIVESDSTLLPWLQKKIAHELTAEILKQGLIRFERRRNAELSGEIMTAKIYIFKPNKLRKEGGIK